MINLEPGVEYWVRNMEQERIGVLLKLVNPPCHKSMEAHLGSDFSFSGGLTENAQPWGGPRCIRCGSKHLFLLQKG